MSHARRTPLADDLTEAFRSEAPGLLGFFVRRDVPPHDAADLVSETFLAAWKGTQGNDVEPGMLRAWLFGIARKVLSHYRRGRSRRSALADRVRATLEREPAPHANGSEAELAEHVRELIRCLPDLDQEIVRLVYWEGFTQELVAVILGKPPTVIRTRLSRARRVLREQLADSDDVG